MIFGQSAESVILSKAAQDDTVAKSVSLGKAARDVTGSLIGTSCYGGRAIRAGGRPRPTLEAARDGVEVRIDEPRPPHVQQRGCPKADLQVFFRTAPFQFSLWSTLILRIPLLRRPPDEVLT